MFKKPYRNDKGQKNTKEELRQRSNYLEKLQNASRKVKEASIEYSDSPPPPEKSFKTCAFESTKIKKHFLQKING